MQIAQLSSSFCPEQIQVTSIHISLTKNSQMAMPVFKGECSPPLFLNGKENHDICEQISPVVELSWISFVSLSACTVSGTPPSALPDSSLMFLILFTPYFLTNRCQVLKLIDLLRDITLGAHKACTYIQRQLFLVACGCSGGRKTPPQDWRFGLISPLRKCYMPFILGCKLKTELWNRASISKKCPCHKK